MSVSPHTSTFLQAVEVDGSFIGLGTNESYTHTFPNVSADHTVTADFRVRPKVTPTYGANGTISPSSVVYLGPVTDLRSGVGGTITFTINPNTYYLISDVSVNGASVGVVPTYTFTNIMSNQTIHAVFGNIQYPVTVTYSPASQGVVSPAGTILYNAHFDSPVYYFSPKYGYQVSSFTVNGTPVSVSALNFDVLNSRYLYSVGAIYEAKNIDVQFSEVIRMNSVFFGTGF